MFRRKSILFISLVMAALAFFIAAGQSSAGKPTVLKPCNQCHQPEDKVIRGTLVGVSDKFRTIQVSVGSLVWVVKYGDDLKITGADKLSSIPKDKEIGIRFKGEEKTPYAESLTVKPPAKVAPEKLVTLEEMNKLTAEGPVKGRYLLVDSRPLPRYNEGHLPHAVSLPDDKFDKMKDSVLPAGKGDLIIFYCGGVT